MGRVEQQQQSPRIYINDVRAGLVAPQLALTQKLGLPRREPCKSRPCAEAAAGNRRARVSHVARNVPTCAVLELAAITLNRRTLKVPTTHALSHDVVAASARVPVASAAWRFRVWPARAERVIAAIACLKPFTCCDLCVRTQCYLCLYSMHLLY